MDSNWTKIKVYNKPFEAEIVKNMLLENNIPAVVLNKQDSSYLFGVVELYVDQEHSVEALALIDSFGDEEE
ncbi:putative signal transducing protein [Sphingobacterium daejeonense]|uniref:Signal transducing protein n=1 Tax=Sphingobacterium daejeonense TaxID=371142 RepID=A0ABW3RGH1_9SPHI